MPSLKYTEKHYQLMQFSNTLKLQDGDYGGRYNGTPALIRIKDGEAVAIMLYGGVMDGRGILKSSIELLIEAAR